MVKNLRQLYQGYSSPIAQFVFFLALNLLVAAIVNSFGLDKSAIWSVFQTLLFISSTVSLAIAGMSKVPPYIYYPFSIISFIFFFNLSKKLATVVTQATVEDFPFVANFILLNIVFYFILLIPSLMFRGAKKALERL